MQAGATRAQVATAAEDGNPTAGDLFSFEASNTETPTSTRWGPGDR